MKRKNYKIFILFALILFLSVGYAVVNSVSLTIDGTAGAVSSDLKISFNGTKTVSDTSKGSASVTSGSKTATFTASNMSLNESITFTYTIVNNENDIAANVIMTSSGNSDYFTVSASPASFTVLPGSTKVITVVVTMIKTPLTTADSSTNFTLTLNAAPVDASKYISFTIDGVSYMAEDGMSWQIWVGSSYNTNNFMVFYDTYPYTIISSSGREIQSGGRAVYNSDLIVNQNAYTISVIDAPTES